MPFKTLISRTNIIELLFEKLNIINYRQHTIQVDNTPDFEVFQYSGLNVVPYYFHQSWKFKDLYYSVISADFGRYGVFNYSSVNHILDDFNLPEIQRDEPLERAVERAAKNAHPYSDLFRDHEYDGFKVRKIQVDYVNNQNKTIEYSGFFDGDSTAIGEDIVLIAELNLAVLNANLSDPLYRLLLVDSYLHYSRNEYNQAFFYAFVAFETYLNSSGKQGQLKQKLRELKNGESEIFLNATEELGRFEEMRNTIAHGKEYIEMVESTIKEFYATFIPLIFYVEGHAKTFNGILRAKVKSF
ncbi:hypothetical protein [Pedobacter sp.]|uniref:hypothetical protein n=1 Tax=Pedobacter sp. TaxID=1411316 RepID=UPI003BAD5AAB